MNALVVYESMFGNTRRLAEAIGKGLATAQLSATVTPASEAPLDLGEYQLVVVGAPTHAHTLPKESSRADAAKWVVDPAKELVLESSAGSPGVREWLDRITEIGAARYAVFSTRADMPRIFTGDAAARIAKRLRRRGAEVDAHADFLVDMGSHLAPGEEQRASEWAAHLIPATTR